jgi:hypothetical protein
MEEGVAMVRKEEAVEAGSKEVYKLFAALEEQPSSRILKVSTIGSLQVSFG